MADQSTSDQSTPVDVSGAAPATTPQGPLPYDPNLVYGNPFAGGGGAGESAGQYYAISADGAKHVVPSALIDPQTQDKDTGYVSWKIAPQQKGGVVANEADLQPSGQPTQGPIIANEKDLQPDNSLKGQYAPKAFAVAKSLGMTDQQAQSFSGLIQHESNFDPNAKGTPDPTTGHQAIGLGQMFPAAIQDAGFKQEDMNDPNKQLLAAGTYFKQKLDKYDGNTDMAGMAYNAGDDPKNWNPAYAAAMRKAAGQPVDQQFHQMAGQLFQQQHAASDPDNVQNQPWNFGRNTLNDFTMGGLNVGQSMVDAAQNGQTYGTENALQRAWQTQWLKDHPMASMASDALGFAVPDMALMKGATLGARALGQAVPYVASALDAIAGVNDAYSPIRSGFTAFPRAAATGAAMGVANQSAAPDNDYVKSAVTGAAGGVLGQGVSIAGQGLYGLGRLAYKAGQPINDSLYNSVRQKVAAQLGPNPPALQESAVPGVEYSLPELLGGKNAQMNEQIANASKTDPATMQQQIFANNAARVNYLHDTIGGPEDLAAARAEKDAANDELDNLMSNQPPGPNTVGMDMKGIEKAVNEQLQDQSRTPIEGFPEAMKQIKQKGRLYQNDVPEGKKEGSMEDLEDLDKSHDLEAELEAEMQKQIGGGKPNKLIDDVKSIHGLRRYLDDQLDKMDNPITTNQKVIKRTLTALKEKVVEELEKIDGYAEGMAKVGTAQQKIKMMEFLHSKKLTNIQDLLTPEALQNMIKQIKDAREGLTGGVLGTKNKAKNVTDEVLRRLEILRDDLKISKAAKVPLTLASKAEGAEDPHSSGIIPTLFHGSAGALGYSLGVHVPVPGAAGVGFAAGTMASIGLRHAAKAVAKKEGRVMLDVLLHPSAHPPIPPKASSIPQGGYAGMFGGNSANGLTRAPPEKDKSR